VTASNYYTYVHARRSRIAIQGLLDFACEFVADQMHTRRDLCQIAAAHYYRGRISAFVAAQRDVVEKERCFDDMLSKLGITPHYLPLVRDSEKGIDVWFALDVFDMAIRNAFDVAVLLTGDGDFVPLIQKLNEQGMPSVVMSWDIEDHVDWFGNTLSCQASRVLTDKATFFVPLHKVIDDPDHTYAHLADSLFVSRSPESNGFAKRASETIVNSDGDGRYHGAIYSLHANYGFITPNDGSDNIFFHASDANFENLRVGDLVEYSIGSNLQGACARKVKAV
jgi:cold shock CspA family protein